MKLFFALLSCFGTIGLVSCQENMDVSERPKLIDSTCTASYILPDAQFNYHWAELPQTKFWMEIMQLPPDSCLINIASSRVIVERKSLKTWNSLTSLQKESYRDSIRFAYGLDSSSKIYVTSGKSDFFRFNEVIPSLTNGIEAFQKNQVDPWYAQAILMIESPAQLRKSVSGAYGPFQLMPAIARMYGLTVNKYKDERSDFSRSAYASSSLLKNICIPSAKEILTRNGYQFNESDWWFRLFVLHIYHAGASNVNAVVSEIGNLGSGIELIKKMWHTKAAQFGNNSQNYSQLALAAQCILKRKVGSTSNTL